MPHNLPPALDPASFEVVGDIDDAALDVLAELLVTLSDAEEAKEEAKPPPAK